MKQAAACMPGSCMHALDGRGRRGRRRAERCGGLNLWVTAFRAREVHRSCDFALQTCQHACMLRKLHNPAPKSAAPCRRRLREAGQHYNPPRLLGPCAHLAVQLEGHCHGIRAVRGVRGLHRGRVVGSPAHWRPPYRRPCARARAGGRQTRHRGPGSAGSSHSGPHGALQGGRQTDRRRELSGGADGLAAACGSNHKRVAAVTATIPLGILLHGMVSDTWLKCVTLTPTGHCQGWRSPPC